MLAYGNFLFSHRNKIFPLVLLALFLGFRPRAGIAAWHDTLSFLLLLAGAALRAAVVGLEYIKRGGIDKRIHAKELVTGGLFAHCRNPLYAGNLLVSAGLLLLHGNPWVFLLGMGFFGLTYQAIVLAEEQYLAEKFAAAYEDYRRAVPRWRLKLVGLGATFAGARFNWRRVLAKEYASLASWIGLAAALLLYRTLAASGWQVTPRQVLPTALGLLLLGAATLGLRLLKKSGRLAS